ncbi:MAG: hypothetical protein ACW99U_09605 [Candidatus Thorarchaeota archaeon]|jgi:CO dehydrogenase/acetyl-CoA synthase alpha subunit
MNFRKTMSGLSSAAIRGVIIDLALDVMGEKVQKYKKCGLKCAVECPLILEIRKDLDTARTQDRETLTEDARDLYGL